MILFLFPFPRLLLPSVNLDWWRKHMNWVYSVIVRLLWSFSTLVTNCSSMPAQIWTRSFSNTQNTMNHMRAEQTQILSRYRNWSWDIDTTVQFSCGMHIALNRKKLRNIKLFMFKSISYRTVVLNIHKQNNVYYNFSQCEMFILLGVITFPSLLGLNFLLIPRKSPKSTCNMMLFF